MKRIDELRVRGYIYLVISFAIVVENVIVLVAARSKRKHVVQDLLLFNLALSGVLYFLVVFGALCYFNFVAYSEVPSLCLVQCWFDTVLKLCKYLTRP